MDKGDLGVSTCFESICTYMHINTYNFVEGGAHVTVGKPVVRVQHLLIQMILGKQACKINSKNHQTANSLSPVVNIGLLSGFLATNAHDKPG